MCEAECRVTLGLPVYNGEQFIEETLEAILLQSYQGFRVIVADNASTDRTAEIVDAYCRRDARVQLIRNSQNQGATYNYRLVLDHADTEYFKWIAADDLIHPDFLKLTVAALDSVKEAVLAYSKAAFIDENGRILYRFDSVMQIRSWPLDVVNRSKQMMRALLNDGSAANVIIFGLMRTKTLRSIRPLGNYFGCDYSIVTDMALNGQIIEIPEVLSFYRRHTRSSSHYGRVSPKDQQIFLDPRIANRLVQELQFRRRYLEMFRGIHQANLTTAQRLRIYSSATHDLLARIGWRIKNRGLSAIGIDSMPKGPIDEDVSGLHWTKHKPPEAVDHNVRIDTPFGKFIGPKERQ